MIVITRNGKTTVVTGWPAWLMGAVAILFAWLVLAGIAFVVVGAALTLGLVLLLAIPAIALAAGLGSLLNKRKL